MNKKKLKDELNKNEKEAFITQTPAHKVIEQNYMPYAMAVIAARAIPQIDGFKPSHRKLLYTMRKMGLQKGEKSKSANIVGQTMRLNPHGDAAIYETMIRLTRGAEALATPFIDSKGNFGKTYSRDMACAASRYTEAGLADVCLEIFDGLEKDAVDMVDNYDSTMKEPVLLPTSFPNLLVTPNTGIAVGMASANPGFNLAEVCLACAAWLKNPEIRLIDYMPAPDFSTGGFLLRNKSDIERIYESGRGSVTLRARHKYEPKSNCIEIHEIPYTTTLEAIIDKIVLLVKSQKLREISDVRDETDLNGLKIAIDLKRGADPEELIKKLYRLTTLQDVFSCNFNFLVNGKPKVMGVREIFEEWTSFRKSCLIRQARFEREAKSKQIRLLEGLEIAALDIERVIFIIKNAEKDADVAPNLASSFNISLEQAEYIAEIKLRALNKQQLLKRIKDLALLRSEVAELEKLISDDGALVNLIISQLKKVAKLYGAPRKTEIIEAEGDVASLAEIIPDYPVKVYITKRGYIKKIPISALKRAQDLKNDDEIAQEFDCYNKDELLIFTSLACAYKLKLSEIANGTPSSLGEYIPNVLELDKNEEKILCAVFPGEYDGFILFSFQNGKIAKVSCSAFNIKRKKIERAYSVISPIVSIIHLKNEAKITLERGFEKRMSVSTELIPSFASRSCSGVKVFTQKRGSVMTSARLAQDGDEIFLVSRIPSMGRFALNASQSSF